MGSFYSLPKVARVERLSEFSGYVSICSYQVQLLIESVVSVQYVQDNEFGVIRTFLI